jgi:hypothetical protein
MSAIATFIVAAGKGEPKQMRPSPFGITGPPCLRYLNKSQSDGLANSWRDRMAVNAVFLEVVISDRKAAIVCSAVISSTRL